MTVPTYETIAALALPLKVECKQSDGRIELHSWQTGSQANFADDDAGRALAISWINADQRLLTWLKSNRKAFLAVCSGSRSRQEE